MTPQELADYIRKVLSGAISSKTIEITSADIPDQIVVDRPKNPDHGDWSTNIAMQLSSKNVNH